ncbi:hypothetical protein [Mitsuaria sp. 7]|uniref:hypothetical protein n=1 Tax=Mitsuaria sp. 7 TaxID=1658665 RepID=UPI0007DE09AC|nr:hypothetical protein [Mitsuaria sp. 7]ANH67694.1 hypothetical protein ABE85_09155 [Mitsuaria sp. 7]
MKLSDLEFQELRGFMEPSEADSEVEMLRSKTRPLRDNPEAAIPPEGVADPAQVGEAPIDQPLEALTQSPPKF